MNNQIWVSPNGGDGWKVKKSQANRASFLGDTKQEALKQARIIAINQGLELIIQKKDGTIQERNSYGNDPFPPKG